MSDFYRIEIVEAADFLCRESADSQPYLIEQLIPVRSQTIWQGRPKVGKSHTLLQLAHDAAAGLPVFGRFVVPRPVRTCFMEFEEPEAITKGRYEKILFANTAPPPGPGMLWFFSTNDLHRYRLLPGELLRSRKKELFRVLQQRRIELLIIIALRRLWRGDPNEPSTAEELNDTLDEMLQETDVTLLLANHTRKAGAKTAEARGFGSTMFAARADATFELSRESAELRRMSVEARFDAPPTFFLRKEPIGDGEIVRAVADPEEEAKRRLVELVGEGKSLRKAAEEIAMPYASAHRLLKS